MNPETAKIIDRLVTSRDDLRKLDIADYAMIRDAREVMADAANALTNYAKTFAVIQETDQAALNPSQGVEQVGPCMWCGNAILPGQPTGMVDGDRLHLHCAAEEADNATFDRDMGFD